MESLGLSIIPEQNLCVTVKMPLIILHPRVALNTKLTIGDTHVYDAVPAGRQSLYIHCSVFQVAAVFLIAVIRIEKQK